jgi:CheY-like chemotaxis protein
MSISNLTTFLVVEDSDLDVEKIERGFVRLKIVNPIVRAKDGIEALQILRGECLEKSIDHPYLILLDLNMPRMNGLEFLTELRSDAKLKHAVVFVLTTSDHHADVYSAHQHNIAGYIVKPIRREQMLDALNTMNLYWNLCEYPQNGS